MHTQGFCSKKNITMWHTPPTHVQPSFSQIFTMYINNLKALRQTYNKVYFAKQDIFQTYLTQGNFSCL